MRLFESIAYSSVSLFTGRDNRRYAGRVKCYFNVPLGTRFACWPAEGMWTAPTSAELASAWRISP